MRSIIWTQALASAVAAIASDPLQSADTQARAHEIRQAAPGDALKPWQSGDFISMLRQRLAPGAATSDAFESAWSEALETAREEPGASRVSIGPGARFNFSSDYLAQCGGAIAGIDVAPIPSADGAIGSFLVVELAGYEGERVARSGFASSYDAWQWVKGHYVEGETEALHVDVARIGPDGARSYDI